jgi:hypothetical protein
MRRLFSALFLIILPAARVWAAAWDYDGNRIAISFDGNSAPDDQYKWPTGDPDDWGALAASCAIIAKLGLQEKLVHCSYNNFIDAPSGPDEENQLKISADGAIERWAFDPGVFFDVTTQLDAAVANLALEMGRSTPEDPLYFCHAGLSEFVYLAVEETIARGHLEALAHVRLLSHSRFNENEQRRPWHRTWADVRELSGDRIQYRKIRDQNEKTDPDVLWNSGDNFSVWFWMRDHPDPDVRWMYTRLEAHSGGVADISDCGMLFFLLTGDEAGSPEALRRFVGDGITTSAE